jgi:hypothetical protein
MNERKLYILVEKCEGGCQELVMKLVLATIGMAT